MKVFLKIGLTCFLILLFFSFLAWITLNPPQIQGNLIDIQIIKTNTNIMLDSQYSKVDQHFFIVISNASKSPVSYDVKRDINLAYLKNEKWETNDVGHFFTEGVLLGPHELQKIENFGRVPPGTTAVRAELSYISPTWRGKVAEKVSYRSYFYPMFGGLSQIDVESRSKTPWSPIYYFDAVTNKPH
jgi:hypothetical protein